MTQSNGGNSVDQRRLTSTLSIIDMVARHVTDLTLIAAQDTPEWLPTLSIPLGWQIAHLDSNSPQPLRIAVCGERSGGGWDGCETLSLFRFTGMPPDGLVAENNDCSLRGLNADGITTHALATPAVPRVCAVRSSGYFTAGTRRMWAQYSTYVAPSETSGEGRLIAHAVFSGSDARVRLRDDITDLCDSVHAAFLDMIPTVGEDDATTPLPVMEVHRNGT
ncbi:hypothetical protein [Mycobacterium hubeiense]|uniref:hypothetical protein n=1 Tax=Mycobacterium hubeiense TaxID=1867256 RepID=UPI00115B76FF|nr:hypothetical protein [Mycobacterium sp. QGD 101]